MRRFPRNPAAREPPPILRQNRRFAKFPSLTPATARKSAHLPSSRALRIHGRIPLRPVAAAEPGRRSRFSRASRGPWYPRDVPDAEDSRLRDAPHLPAFPLENLPKNPREFIEFYLNLSIFSEIIICIIRVPRLARAAARFPPSAPRSPPEKAKADGRPLQHTPSKRKPGDGNCGEMRVDRSRRREVNPDPQGGVVLFLLVGCVDDLQQPRQVGVFEPDWGGRLHGKEG